MELFSKKISSIRAVALKIRCRRSEIEDKFRANALLALPARNVDEIVRLVGRLEQIAFD